MIGRREGMTRRKKGMTGRRKSMTGKEDKMKRKGLENDLVVKKNHIFALAGLCSGSQHLHEGSQLPVTPKEPDPFFWSP